MKNKKIVVSVLGILGIVLATIGVTYAFFSYSKTGTIDNTITSGSINFKYTEGNRKIELDELMPMTDDQGKALSNYFDFDISAKTSRTVDIPYDITVRKATGENILPDSIIKVYLTKVVNGVEEDILLDTADHLNGYSNSKINIPASEKLLYTSKVLAGDTNYSVSYRLRMWISTSANYIDQTGQTDQYPLEGKSYSLTVNVYGEGLDIGESGVATRQNINIQSISLDNSNLTLENGVYTGEAIMPEGETTMTKTIVVTTENPNATVTAEKVQSPTSMNIEKSKTKKLSTSVQLENLTVGENNYILTVRGEDNRTTHQYNLRIIVDVADPFEGDSWATIQYNVTHGNIDRYNLGDTRQVELTWANGDKETHTLRVSNKTSCTDALIENPNLTSTTGCGFVVEFDDIISMQQFDTTHTGVEGYPETDMYYYVTNTVYNSLPSDLRNVMMNTTVISGHTGGVTCDTTLTTRDENCNYITTDKIYLLNLQEVTNLSQTDKGHNFEISDSGSSRRLDLYASPSKLNKKYNNERKSWWLRSTSTYYGNTNANFYYNWSNGFNCSSRSSTFGVSPAFRIG